MLNDFKQPISMSLAPPDRNFALIDCAPQQHMREGTMIESACLLNNRVIVYYFHQRFEVDIFPHGQRDIQPDEGIHEQTCVRFGLKNAGDRGLALWKLTNGRWVNQGYSRLRSSCRGF